ncbi:hypothetical protein [Streptomyces sp. NPDC020917]|uniref:hypothetical protein n=1 Tax=Streptomyces sp. NPDC020917 TaxID=3365102 RepID=UPI00378F938F
MATEDSLVPPPESRIAEVATGLTAVGLRPKRVEDRGHTSLEAAVPRTFPDASWPRLLALLGKADWFGLADSSARGRSLWAAFHNSTPAPNDTAAADARDQP